MATLLPPLTLSLSQSRKSGVLDPLLALSPYGLSLAMQLGQVMELWVVRELWSILDNSCFYLQHPEVMMPPTPDMAIASDLPIPVLDETTIQAWEQARTNIDITGLNVFWVGDALGQSLLPDGTKPNILRQYEHLAQSLECFNRQRSAIAEPLNAACRDTIALAAALNSAVILTVLPPPHSAPDLPPVICRILTSWGIACRQIDPHDPIAEIERDHLRHLVVHANLSKLLWSGLRLAVLHLSVPLAPSSLWTDGESEAPIEVDEFGSLPQQWPAEQSGAWATPETNYWSQAKGFWYAF